MFAKIIDQDGKKIVEFEVQKISFEYAPRIMPILYFPQTFTASNLETAEAVERWLNNDSHSHT